MFNSKTKKESLDRLKESVQHYDKLIKETNDNSEKLLDIRLKAIKLINITKKYINTINNIPSSYEKQFYEIDFNVSRFNDNLKEIENEFDNEHGIKDNHSGSKFAAAGIATGAGVATLGPTAAMAIATTFGTASTGTAIASLSGVAATNAALAWLGGGALVAGGSGMAGGSALLALAGPIGWAIGSTAIIGGGLYSNKKNKEIAKEADFKRKQIEKAIKDFENFDKQILNMHKNTIDDGKEINKVYEKFNEINKDDFNLLTVDEQYELGSLVNKVKSFAELLNKKVKQEC